RHEGHAHPLTRTHRRKDTAMITTDFTDKVVFITGAGVGIGRATALAFDEAGADVALVSIDEDDLNETARRVTDTGRRATPTVAGHRTARPLHRRRWLRRQRRPGGRLLESRRIRPDRLRGQQRRHRTAADTAR